MALASDVITRVRHTLLDPGTTYRWTDAELLLWITDAQRDIVAAFPEANTVSTLITPGASDVRLDLRVLAATTPIAILRFATAHNELDGIEGYELKVVEKHVMDSLDPQWVGYRPATAADVTAGAFVVGAQYTIATVGTTDFTLIGASANTIGVAFTATGAGTGDGTATPSGYNSPAYNPYYYKAVVFDPKDRYSFYLYPRANEDFSVYVTYTAVPDDVTLVTDVLSLSDQYLSAIHDYVVFRALTKDSIYTGAPNKAAEFQQSFLQKLALYNSKADATAPTGARAPDEH